MKRKMKEQAGQGMSEYMILVMLIAVGSIAMTRTVGTTIRQKLDRINRSLGKVNVPRGHGTKEEQDHDQDQEPQSIFGQIFGGGR